MSHYRYPVRAVAYVNERVVLCDDGSTWEWIGTEDDPDQPGAWRQIRPPLYPRIAAMCPNCGAKLIEQPL